MLYSWNKLYKVQTKKNALKSGKSCANCDSCKAKSRQGDFIPMIGCGRGHGVYDLTIAYRVSFYGICRFWSLAEDRSIKLRAERFQHFADVITMQPKETK